ncbi:kinase-like domain-containing protein [Epithele typhae]|uniref:kinase-like domain-containing protein n=1 Tax=Epithele typhae TaxID=378194 RepID=UPI002007BD51|nr:kinase-like domain-containing protein [Epithele typhae]KAH9939781.1 kinase-like domain-containing protein [Epithele typhae]
MSRAFFRQLLQATRLTHGSAVNSCHFINTSATIYDQGGRTSTQSPLHRALKPESDNGDVKEIRRRAQDNPWTLEEPSWRPCSFNESPGYAPLQLGEVLSGNYAQYKAIRKLGWGTDSSVWLVERVASGHPELLPGRLLVAKVLTMHSTWLEHRKITSQIILSIELARHGEDMPGTNSTVPMHDFGAHQTRHGSHLFTVMPPMSTDVDRVQLALQTVDPDRDVLLVRRVVKQVLRGLECVHELGFVHGGALAPIYPTTALVTLLVGTDIKAENLGVPLGDEDIPELKKYLERVPAETLPPRVFPDYGPDPVTCVKTQPYPSFGHNHEVPRLFVQLGDFGSSISVSRDTTGMLAMPRMLRAPEVILGRRWGQPIDIWALGCLAAELLLREMLFFPDESVGEDDVGDSEHLEQMIHVLGPFSQATLAKCPERDRHFDADGSLKPFVGKKKMLPCPRLRQRLAGAGLTGNTLDEMDGFLRLMLTLDPDERATASELHRHPFINRFDYENNILE